MFAFNAHKPDSSPRTPHGPRIHQEILIIAGCRPNIKKKGKKEFLGSAFIFFEGEEGTPRDAQELPPSCVHCTQVAVSVTVPEPPVC